MSQPAAKYAAFRNDFFCKFPYVLPCLIGVAICLFSFIAASIFLEETLHKTKAEASSSRGGDSERQSSTDSGIELSAQIQEGGEVNGDEEKLIPPSYDGGLVVMESDIDSESDGGILSFDEDATSDTELLVNTGRVRERRRQWRLRQWADSWSPNVVVRRTQQKAGRCWGRCGACATNCISCTPKQVGLFLVGKLKVLLYKLLEVGRLITDRKVILSTALYGMYGSFHVMANETFPLLMVTCYANGGYHLDDNELGVVVMCSGAVQLLWQLLVYPHIARYLGYRKTLQFGILVFIVCYMLLPFSNRITGPIEPQDPLCLNATSNSSSSIFSGSGSGSGSGVFENATDTNSTAYCEIDDVIGVNENSIKRVPISVWLILLAVMCLLVISRISGFVSLFILIGNSSLPETRGSVNGISQSLVAIGRSVGPVLGSILFAWSESNGRGWPLDYHFVFNLCAVFGILLIFISFLLPKSIEKKRERPAISDS
jgi:MFS family permease